MADIEDLKIECQSISSGSSSDSDSGSDSSDSDSSSRSSESELPQKKRRRGRPERPRKSYRVAKSLERPPGNWRARARSEDQGRRDYRDFHRGHHDHHDRHDHRDHHDRYDRRYDHRDRRDVRDFDRARSGSPSRRRSEARGASDARHARGAGDRADRDWRLPLARHRRFRSDSPRYRARARQVPPSDKPRRFGMKVLEEDREMAARNPPLFISCSRRTDVPWGFLRQYLTGFEDGFLYIASGPRKNPVVRAVCVQPYDRETGKGVLCVSWWSKNYKKWIAAWQKPNSVLHRYPVNLFNFTVNSDNPTLEPGVDTSLPERLGQLTWLAQAFGAHALIPRFDPIVHYRNIVGGQVMDNLHDFEVIVRHVGSLGIDNIVFSFCQAYPKSVRNMRDVGLELVTLSRAEQCAVLDKLMPMAHRYGVQMRCCGDKGLVGYPITQSEVEGIVSAAQREEHRGNFPVIGQSRCVDARLADRIAKEKGINVFMSMAKDLRQRKECECTRSTDIGQYTLQCPHGCVYCYANPLRRRGNVAQTQAPIAFPDHAAPAAPPAPPAPAAPSGFLGFCPPAMPPAHMTYAPDMTQAVWPAGLMSYAAADPAEVMAKLGCHVPSMGSFAANEPPMSA
ncbi:unnamed protein product [Effrenium voratum]|uniref:Uncharacterized protein n=1 Tax=Effrenium voratum TaxID=2562239 RepID=A0AA36MNU2_9DINO|nr:unnamed protein product [Effrenium voratum]CAJ1428786.1 unnamed protein product [Effrenium voratum]